MRKPKQTQGTPLQKGDLDESDLALKYPTLYGYLTDERWDTGEPRKTSTLLIFTEEGMLKACLNDRALSQSTFLAGDSLETLLVALETCLAKDSVLWKPHKKY